MRTGVETVHAYFEAIRARDLDTLADVFADDAVLVNSAGTFDGREAIVGFYRDIAFMVGDLWPDPGALIVDGDHVAVEIRVRMNGNMSEVADVFTLDGNRIARLAIYGLFYTQ